MMKHLLHFKLIKSIVRRYIVIYGALVEDVRLHIAETLEEISKLHRCFKKSEDADKYLEVAQQIRGSRAISKHIYGPIYWTYY
jgi:hypothetical protein